jgi:hypothetical protein
MRQLLASRSPPPSSRLPVRLAFTKREIAGRSRFWVRVHPGVDALRMAAIADLRGSVPHGLLRIPDFVARLFQFEQQHSTATLVRE